MKTIFFILSATTLLSLSAFSDGGTRSIISLIGQIADEVENGSLSKISAEQQREVRTNLESTLGILRNQDSDSKKLICKVSSKYSSYFRLFNGKIEIGNDLNQALCLKLRDNSNRGLVCAPSLVYSSYFRVYETQTGNTIGNDTNVESCLQMVKAATRSYVCAPSLKYSSYYSIYDRQTRESIGGEMSLEACLRSIGDSGLREDN